MKICKDAARCSAIHCTVNDEQFDEHVFAFIEGAEWRINSVWHTDLKEAQTQRNLLVAFTSGRVGMFDDIRLLKGIEDLVARYAYVDELLPSK